MSLSPAAQDLRLFQYLAPNTFSQLLAQSPIASKSLKGNKTTHSPKVDSGHEDADTDADPSPHAQPPAPTPSIKSEPDSQPTSSTHAVENTNQDPVQNTAGPVAAEITALLDDGRLPVVRSSSPFSAKVDSVDHGYMSDADIPEKSFRKTQGYHKLSNPQKVIWDNERAKKFVQEGKSKHFECLDHLLGGQPCSTLQEYLPSRMTARSVISSFFGHNKDGWNQIPKSVRVFLCRKCYQRHQHKLDSHMASIQLPLFRELVDRLEKWRPGCLFKIQLTTAMERKVGKFNVKMEKEGSVRRIVAAEVDSGDLDGKASRAANTPVLLAIKLENRFGGNHKTTRDLRNLLDWLETKLADSTIEDLPAFEALLEEYPQDMEQMRAQKNSRDALEKTLLMKVPKNLSSTAEQITESENTPTHRPARAASRKKPRPINGSRVVNATADSVSNDHSVAPKERAINTGSSALAEPSARPKILLKLKGKKTVRAGSTTIETQPRIKKRKRVTVPTSEDSKNGEESAAPTKKVKRAKLLAKAESEQAAPVEEVAPEQQHVEVTNGSTHLASLTFSDLRVIIDFAPGS
ncbi:hypothetical protein E4T50_03578 [Aureobasidium sp. EXF-12298]|nr:hypothetical protein E4T50_03578 [Aureobasidium sp. EXF-12298]